MDVNRTIFDKYQDKMFIFILGEELLLRENPSNINKCLFSVLFTINSHINTNHFTAVDKNTCHKRSYMSEGILLLDTHPGVMVDMWQTGYMRQ